MNRRSEDEARVQPFRERVRSATREAILEAAERVFARRGVAGAKMEEIAEQAGVAVGTLYNYFDDRSALMSAVLEENQRELDEHLEAGLPPDAAPIEEQLRRLVSVVFEHVDAHSDLFSMLVEEELATGRVGSSSRRRPPVLRVVHQRAAAIVATGVAQGVLRPEDAPLHASLLVGMMRGVFTWHLFSPDRPPMTTLVEPVVRTFLHGTGRTA